MDDPGLHDGEKDRYYPEEQHHPFFDVPVIASAVFSFEERRDRKDGCRKTADQQHHVVMSGKAGLVRVMGAEQPVLVLEELGDEPGAALDGLIPVPGEGDEEGDEKEEERVPPGKEQAETVVDEVGTQHKQEDHQCHLPLCEDCQAHKYARPDHIIQLTPKLGFVELVPLPVIQDKVIKREESKQVEPGVDDP